MVVLGDASPSMDVAIEVSTIVASLLRTLANARLVFFCDHFMEPPFIPKNVEQVSRNYAETEPLWAASAFEATHWLLAAAHG